MNNLKIILAMIGLVAIGFAGGFFVHQTMVEKRLTDIAIHGPRNPLHNRMIDLLDLTDEQLETLKPILKEHHQQMRQMTRTTRIHRRQLFESLHKALEAELTEAQKEKMSRFLERQKRFQEHRMHDDSTHSSHDKERKKRLRKME